MVHWDQEILIPEIKQWVLFYAVSVQGGTFCELESCDDFGARQKISKCSSKYPKCSGGTVTVSRKTKRNFPQSMILSVNCLINRKSLTL